MSLYCDGETALLRLSYSSDHAGVALSEWAAQVGVAFVDTSLWIASRRQEIDDELVPFRYRGQAATLPGIAVGGQDDSSSSIRSIIDTHLVATAAIPQVIATQQTKPWWGQRSDMPAHRQ
ncbi:MAG: hypothetical protein KJO07_00770 [Deltaproteobacteria bacterium]|nr:hypothetical protein [Deltaproteobacteria bacterium]